MGKQESGQDIYALLRPVSLSKKDIRTPELLRAVLSAHKINAAQWPNGELNSLFSEWHERADCDLVTIGKELFRKTNPIYVAITHEDPNEGLLYLHEEKRLELDESGHPTGREKRKRIDLPGSLAEKGKVGETSTDASMRGIFQELHTHVSPTQLHIIDMDMHFVPSPDMYEGLVTRRQSTYFQCAFNDRQYKPNGAVLFPPDSNEQYAYMEKDMDSKTLTLWRWSKEPIHPPQSKIMKS